MVILTEAEAQRFWSKVEPGANGCQLWTGCRMPTGYGQWALRGKTQLVHRLAYEMVHGSIPAGMQIDHLCRVKNCISVPHLEVVTHAENLRRAAEAGGCREYATQCPAGHPYDEANTSWQKSGWRRCKQCNRDRAERYRKRLMSTR